eukprot:GFYU01005686.1.p1 GENE.GFYU01005686.1~~GFYU01005686.1.p1  ORF type:complete len:1561 (-),score=558.29 GFYU01005686.1:520-5202(-)
MDNFMQRVSDGKDKAKASIRRSVGSINAKLPSAQPLMGKMKRPSWMKNDNMKRPSWMSGDFKRPHFDVSWDNVKNKMQPPSWEDVKSKLTVKSFKSIDWEKLRKSIGQGSFSTLLGLPFEDGRTEFQTTRGFHINNGISTNYDGHDVFEASAGTARDPGYHAGPFPNNYVSRTKYTFLTYLPKNAMEQAQKVANLYFIFVAILATASWSPLSPVAALAPLLFVIILTALKDGIEDFRRYLGDVALNSRKVRVVRANPVLSGEDLLASGTQRPGSIGSLRGTKDDIESGLKKPLNDRPESTRKSVSIEPIVLGEVDWMDLQVGDIINLSRNDICPADVILLSSSDENDMCYVDTSTMDGQPNYKVRRCVPGVPSIGLLREQGAVGGLKHFQNLSGKVTVTLPEVQYDSLDGGIEMTNEKGDYCGGALTFMNVIPRGCVIKHTEQIFGIVTFTGAQCKTLQWGTTRPRWKQSTVEQWLQSMVTFMFFFLLTICVICGFAAGFAAHRADGRHQYLALQASENFGGKPEHVAWLSFFGYFVLFSAVIPISLYITLEFMRLMAAYFIENDPDMYHGESNTSARARTTSLVEDLGAVEFLLTDKTGTLTRGDMQLSRVAIGEDVYGKSITESERCRARWGGKRSIAYTTIASKLNDLSDVHQMGGHRARSDFIDDRWFPQQKWFHSVQAHDEKAVRQRGNIEDFWRAVCVCNTVVPVPSLDADVGLEYHCASPDEAALINAAFECGFELDSREATKDKTTQSITGYKVNVTNKARNRKKETFEIEAILEFTNDRGMMSVVCKDSNSRHHVFTKGKETSVRKSLKASWKDDAAQVKVLDSRVSEFAKEGLRTMVFGHRALSDQEMDAITKAAQKYDSAKPNERPDRFRILCDLVETDLEVMGATGIEDQLQVGVPETVESLRRAGIKLWMVTGDRLETAVAVASSAAMLTDNTQILQIPLREKKRPATEEIEALYELVMPDRLSTGQYAFAITGDQLEQLYEDERETNGVKTYFGLFLQMASRCKGGVLAVNMLPQHKTMLADILNQKIYQDKVLERTDKTRPLVVAAVGDGANDVGMIQTAQIGLAISGGSGVQATLSADFSVAQFRHLNTLLLVQGRWSYERVAKCVLYFFYKNMLLAMTLFWYSWFNMSSATSFYDPTYVALYNLVFTSIPVFVMGIFDQDVSRTKTQNAPEMYGYQRNKPTLSFKSFRNTLFEAICHGFIIVFLTVWPLNENVYRDGSTADLWVIGTAVYTNMLLVVTTRLCLETYYFTWWHLIVYVGSVFSWFVFCGAWTSPEYSDMATNTTQENILRMLLKTNVFGLTSVLSLFGCIVPSMAWKYYRRQYGVKSPGNKYATRFWSRRELSPVVLYQEADRAGTTITTRVKNPVRDQDRDKPMYMLTVHMSDGSNNAINTTEWLGGCFSQQRGNHPFSDEVVTLDADGNPVVRKKTELGSDSPLASRMKIRSGGDGSSKKKKDRKDRRDDDDDDRKDRKDRKSSNSNRDRDDDDDRKDRKDRKSKSNRDDDDDRKDRKDRKSSKSNRDRDDDDDIESGRKGGRRGDKDDESE